MSIFDTALSDLAKSPLKSFVQGTLPPSQYVHMSNTTQYWLSSDMPKPETKTDQSITYHLNELGYRSEPFTRGADRHVLVLGCSCTMGIGIKEEERWSNLVLSNLTKETGLSYRQWNFAVAGAGADYVAMMASQVVPVLKPDMALVLFPPLGRRMHFPSALERLYFTPRSTPLSRYKEVHRAFVEMDTPENALTDFFRSFWSVNATFAQYGIPWRWSTVNTIEPTKLAPFVDVSRHVGSCLTRIDWARDEVHEGPKTHERFANAFRINCSSA